ncbi:unnamed protein product (mitochondrion) [Plasmodiophora brassicae]|uniref:Guanine nucleotide-binding protein-like 1 n=1 Tax=Plasmodiophora brassicae TaxID=37360 RepID=A0A3P3YI31_PLABS|nr:unnamed protein product [Plasmodiophora brassicae]
MPRRRPISGAAKKSILKAKRAARRQQAAHGHDDDDDADAEQAPPATTALGRESPVPAAADRRTWVQREPRAVIEARKLTSLQPLHRDPNGTRLSWRELTARHPISIPERPPWTYSMTKEQLDENETVAFRRWLADLDATYDRNALNFFEHNLEVWRQLWRTIETSHIICIVCDVRHPMFFFHLGLYRYVVHRHHKPVVVVLNKSDLVPDRFVRQWTAFFEANFPMLRVVSFSSRQVVRITDDDECKLSDTVPDDSCEDASDTSADEDMAEHGRRHSADRTAGTSVPDVRERVRGGKRRFRSTFQAIGRGRLFDVCTSLLSVGAVVEPMTLDESAQTRPDVGKRHVIGMVGMPSSGKSSMVNALIGKHVVSTSRTPGHTKHFQTMILDENWVLMDCPGLVFPTVGEPRALQIVMGLYPLAQVAEPYSVVQFIAERIEKGWLSAKGTGRPNAHRGAIAILTDVVDGRVLLAFHPPPGVNPDISQCLLSDGHTSIK